MKKKKDTRGGANRNQGLRPGTYKNALKEPSQRRSEKKMVSFTPDELRRVLDAMTASGIEIFNEFGRDAILERAESNKKNERDCMPRRVHG